MARILTIFMLLFIAQKTFSQPADSFYVNPRQPASFKGGDAGLETYLVNNMVYPPVAAGATGTVELKLWINQKGEVVKADISKSLQPALDSACLLAASHMPKWKPAMHFGAKVKSICFLPINFKADPLLKPDSQPINEKMPEFPGGDIARTEFIKKNLRYPEDARRRNKQGRVPVRFVIDEEGNVLDPVVLHPVYPSIDEEAVRIVKLMHWKPGVQDGKPVKVYFTLPISFTLE